MMILMEMMLERLWCLFMEVDKVANEVTDMEVDKVTNMVAEIPNEDFDYMSGDY